MHLDNPEHFFLCWWLLLGFLFGHSSIWHVKHSCSMLGKQPNKLIIDCLSNFTYIWEFSITCPKYHIIPQSFPSTLKIDGKQRWITMLLSLLIPKIPHPFIHHLKIWLKKIHFSFIRQTNFGWMFDPSLLEQWHGSPHSDVISLSLLSLPILQYHGILEL